MSSVFTPPNLLWLVTDHQTYVHHRLRSGAPPPRPALERISREGVSFTHAYTSCPICTPARASMLTGLYPHRHGMTANDGRFGSRREFDPDQKMISHSLVDAGYRCGYFGKWHCGEERIAIDYGFEGFSLPGYGYPYESLAYRAYLKELNLPLPCIHLEDMTDDFRSQGDRLPINRGNWFDAVAGSAILEGSVETHEAFFVSHLASQWLRQHAGGGRPFFLRVDIWGPHPPYVVAPPFVNSIKIEDIPRYPNFDSDLRHRPEHHRDYQEYWSKELAFDWSQWKHQLARCYEHGALVDSALERILSVLDQTKQAQNTIVVYTADHGDALASNGGVANKGAMMVEETCRIPLVIRYPEHLKPGLECRKLVSNMDLAPTVLELAGAEQPSPMDGRSLVKLLEDPGMSEWPDSLLVEHYGLNTHQFQRMLRCRNYKYVAQMDGFEELYDLEKDPYELHNMALHAAAEPRLRKMRMQLVTKMASIEDNSSHAQALIGAVQGKGE